MNLDLLYMDAGINCIEAFVDEISYIGVSFSEAQLQKLQCLLYFLMFSVRSLFAYISRQVVDDRIGQVVRRPVRIDLKLR